MFQSIKDTFSTEPVHLILAKFEPEHGLIDRKGNTDVDNTRAPSSNIPDEEEQCDWKSDKNFGQEADLRKRLTRATQLEQGQLQLEAEVWGSCTIQDGGTGSVPS